MEMHEPEQKNKQEKKSEKRKHWPPVGFAWFLLFLVLHKARRCGVSRQNRKAKQTIKQLIVVHFDFARYGLHAASRTILVGNGHPNLRWLQINSVIRPRWSHVLTSSKKTHHTVFGFFSALSLTLSTKSRISDWTPKKRTPEKTKSEQCKMTQDIPENWLRKEEEKDENRTQNLQLITGKE